MTLPGPHSWQLHAFAVCMLGGIAIGFGFDLYRAARAVGRPGPLVTAVGDVLFTLAAAAWAALVLWEAAWGEPRLYVLVAFVAGLSVYAALASATILPVARACCRGLYRVLRPIFRAMRWAGTVAAAALRALWPATADANEEKS